MGFWSKLFGKRELSEAELTHQAQVFLQEAEQMASQDPKAAMDFIRDHSEELGGALKLEKPLHQQFRSLVLSIKSKLDPAGTSSTLPSVALLSWDNVETIGDLVTEAKGIEEEIIYTVPTREKDDAAPFSQVQALCELASDSKLAMVVAFDMAIFFRKSLVLMAEGNLDPDNDEVGPALEEFAHEKGPKVNFY